jgi:nitronate monooxygenase
LLLERTGINLPRAIRVNMTLKKIASRLRLPLVAAPMLRVSGVDLVTAVCRRGRLAPSQPRTPAQSKNSITGWSRSTIALPVGPSARATLPQSDRPAAALPGRPRFLVRDKVEMVITRVGSSAAAVGPLHEVGCLVFADGASLDHAEKGIKAGADGLILLSAGAGDQTSWANPFAFVRAVRA